MLWSTVTICPVSSPKGLLCTLWHWEWILKLLKAAVLWNEACISQVWYWLSPDLSVLCESRKADIQSMYNLLLKSMRDWSECICKTFSGKWFWYENHIWTFCDTKMHNVTIPKKERKWLVSARGASAVMLRN